jgi:hypothetical protein
MVVRVLRAIRVLDVTHSLPLGREIRAQAASKFQNFGAAHDVELRSIFDSVTGCQQLVVRKTDAGASRSALLFPVLRLDDPDDEQADTVPRLPHHRTTSAYGHIPLCLSRSLALVRSLSLSRARSRSRSVGSGAESPTTRFR